MQKYTKNTRRVRYAGLLSTKFSPMAIFWKVGISNRRIKRVERAVLPSPVGLLLLSKRQQDLTTTHTTALCHWSFFQFSRKKNIKKHRPWHGSSHCISLFYACQGLRFGAGKIRLRWSKFPQRHNDGRQRNIVFTAKDNIVSQLWHDISTSVRRLCHIRDTFVAQWW